MESEEREEGSGGLGSGGEGGALPVQGQKRVVLEGRGGSQRQASAPLEGMDEGGDTQATQPESQVLVPTPAATRPPSKAYFDGSLSGSASAEKAAAAAGAGGGGGGAPTR